MNPVVKTSDVMTPETYKQIIRPIVNELIHHVRNYHDLGIHTIDPDFYNLFYMKTDIFAEAKAEIGHLDTFKIIKTICLTADTSKISEKFAKKHNYKGLVITHDSGFPIHGDILFDLLMYEKPNYTDECFDYVWNVLKLRPNENSPRNLGYKYCDTVEDVKSLYDFRMDGNDLSSWVSSRRKTSRAKYIRDQMSLYKS